CRPQKITGSSNWITMSQTGRLPPPRARWRIGTASTAFGPGQGRVRPGSGADQLPEADRAFEIAANRPSGNALNRSPKFVGSFPPLQGSAVVQPTVVPCRARLAPKKARPGTPSRGKQYRS